MREPAPLACLTSSAYAQAARRGGDPVVAARREWEGSHPRAGEAAEPEHQLALGPLAFDELLVPRPRQDEHGPWWDEDEPRRFGRWARRLWDGLLQSEQLEDR
jgi:exodeoxyribonuclease V gamma subunit